MQKINKMLHTAGVRLLLIVGVHRISFVKIRNVQICQSLCRILLKILPPRANALCAGEKQWRMKTR